MKKRLTTYIFLIAALGIALSSAFGVWSSHQRELDTARQTLGELLDLMDAQDYYTDAEKWAAQFATAAPDKRLTIIAPDGTVLSDTYGEVTANHATRPEFQEALATGRGEAIRTSGTMGTTVLYEARRFTDGNVGRVAMSIASVNALFLRGITGFAVAALAALALALLLARKLAVKTAAPIEEETEQLHREGEKLQSVRSEFAANVSHELKTPLTSIKGFTDMLSSGMVKNPEDQKRFITMIGVEVDRLIELINDVLKISELESVVIPQSDDRADLLNVAREAVEFLAPAAKKAGVDIRVSGEDAAAAVAPARLRELVQNLVENGIKYNVPGGRVDVTVSRGAGKVTIAVSDTGIGIPEEARERVFERFYRVDKGRNRKTGGTGLGLSIVKHITMLYGGTIALESELGKGTAVTVSFPEAK
ncbi:MAG: hypothetical protein EOM52_04395 [Clostridia bacterium]|nr:hypothetical protein [Clostridia bacterium]